MSYTIIYLGKYENHISTHICKDEKELRNFIIYDLVPEYDFDDFDDISNKIPFMVFEGDLGEPKNIVFKKSIELEIK
jgi:hypothetical protein